jgi:hypothetical protein
MVSSGFLMLWGLRMHQGVVKQVAGCLSAYQFLDHGLYLEDHFYNP